MHSAQPFRDGVIHLGGGRRAGYGNPVGGFFEQGEMVGTVIEEIACLFVGQQHPAPRRKRDASGVLTGDAPGAIKSEHRARRAWARTGQSSDFRIGHGIGTEQRIAKGLAQPDFQPAFMRTRKGGEVEVEDLG